MSGSPQKADAALLRKSQPVQNPQQGGLAGAVRSQQRHPLAGRNGQAQIVERHHLVVTKCNLANVKDRNRHRILDFGFCDFGLGSGIGQREALTLQL